MHGQNHIKFILTILHKSLINALNMLTALYSYWSTPTSFSPQIAILMEFWYISWAWSAKWMSRCKYQVKEQCLIRAT